ncbi:MAG: helix-turn-helix domain-containing protein [Anaerocolumna sp.]
MFSENLKILRKKKGITQEELANRLHVVRQTISKWEKGLSIPDADMLIKIADVFEVSVSEILGIKLDNNLNNNLNNNLDSNIGNKFDRDNLADQLRNINEQLVIKNGRWHRFFKILAIIVGFIIAIYVILVIIGIISFQIFKIQSKSEVVETSMEEIIVNDEEIVVGVVEDKTFITKEMYERATAFKEGDLTRIAAAMRKAVLGEKVTIGVIGGSITEGYSASLYSKGYASLLKKWWENTFLEAEIEFINAGVGGTSSYLGVHRAYEDLLSHQPDFVVVEFSVNDGNSFFYKKSYDNLVRRILKQDNNPAVVLLFMTMEDGTSAQNIDANIGFQYGLSMISYGNGVLLEIEQNHFNWKDISPDNIHPNDRGHAIVGELFSVFLTDVYNRLDAIPKEVIPFKLDPVTKEVYMDATILDSTDIEPMIWGSFKAKKVNTRFPNNWSTDTGEESITFTVEASNIGIMYQKLTNGTGGQYEVIVDGNYMKTLDSNFSGGWGDYGETEEVFVSEERKVRTLEIRKKEGSTGDAFAILGLLIS